MIVNQWIPAAHLGDAVGDNARAIRDLIRRDGHESDIFALTIDDALVGDVRPWGGVDCRAGDVTILHFAMPSPMTSALATLPGTRVLCYHNVTPPAFFAPFDAFDKPILEWSNTLTLRVTQYLSLNYSADLFYVPEVQNDVQFQHSVLLRVSWALF